MHILSCGVPVDHKGSRNLGYKTAGLIAEVIRKIGGKMHPKYPKVFSPIRLGPVELRNRFYASPHTMPMQLGGKPSDDYVAYNAARAKGGLGLVMVSLTVPERSVGAQPCANPKENIPAFRALADAVHAGGAKIFAEPFFQWCASGPWQLLGPAAPIFAPSVAQLNFLDKRTSTREMTKDEIEKMLAAFRQAAENLREAGFDGIMIHASHGALAEQFLSPYFNRRTDEYGGTLENRMRLLVEELTVVREAVGSNMAVGMRMNCDELLEGGYQTKEAYQILKIISDAGLIDFADLDVAVEPNQLHLGMSSGFVEQHVYRPYVEAVRNAAGNIPVLSVLGRLTSVADGEAFLNSGVCDMVGAARAFIAEPELVNNALEGREERSRTCIACNACMIAAFEGGQGCAINPSSYRERYWGKHSFAPAPKQSKLIIVGSGPAGLEAARVGALKGHDVTLFEARQELGGALALWASLPGRETYQQAISWWVREVRRLGVKIHLGCSATAASILSQSPDAVILATGARYNPTGRSAYRDFDIPGHDRGFVYRPEEILSGGALPGGKIIVLDAEGFHAGAGIAEALARAGADVECLTPYFSPLSVRLTYSQEAPFVMQRFFEAGVKLTASTYIKQIGEHEVTVQHAHTGQEYAIKGVDAVILSTGRSPVNELEHALSGNVKQLFVAGDALGARGWANAGYEGHKFARLIGEPDAPASVAECYFGVDDPDFMPFPADMARMTVATG